MSNFNQRFTSETEQKPVAAKEHPNVTSSSSAATAEAPKKSLFGAGKKNVFNPFAKKDSPSAFKGADPPKPTVVQNDNSSFSNPNDNSKFSNDFDRQIKPVALNDTNPLAAVDKKPKTPSGEGSGIAEQISDNYDDDDFDVADSMAKGDDVDFFNKNKNFTGGLAGLTKGDKESEKQSEPSGLGFEEHDNYDFF